MGFYHYMKFLEEKSQAYSPPGSFVPWTRERYDLSIHYTTRLPRFQQKIAQNNQFFFTFILPHIHADENRMNGQPAQKKREPISPAPKGTPFSRRGGGFWYFLPLPPGQRETGLKTKKLRPEEIGALFAAVAQSSSMMMGMIIGLRFTLA
ncbi:MAG: hypothetical protein ACOX8R_02795 [Bacillota bacterium]|jgi:hypothetical protein